MKFGQAMLFFTIPLAITAASHASRAAPPEPVVRVQHIVDPRLPTLTADEQTDVLARARQRIIDAGGPHVTWKLADPLQATELAAALVAQVKPFPLPPPSSLEPEVISAAGLAKIIRPICAGYGSVDQIRALIGPDAIAVDGSYDALATVMAQRFLSQAKLLRSLKASDGSGLTNSPPSAALFRLSTWDVIHAIEGPKAPWTLTLFNGLLLEDAPADAAPHSLTTGVAFGLTNPSNYQSAVGYGSILLDEPTVQALRLGPLNRSQRLDAIAYVIAHEVGLHAALNLADDYTPTAGIARTLATLRTPAELVPTPGIPTKKRLPPRDHLAVYGCMTRAGIALSRKDSTALEREIEFLAKLNLPDQRKLDFTEQLAKSRAQLP